MKNSNEISSESLRSFNAFSFDCWHSGPVSSSSSSLFNDNFAIRLFWWQRNAMRLFQSCSSKLFAKRSRRKWKEKNNSVSRQSFEQSNVNAIDIEASQQALVSKKSKKFDSLFSTEDSNETSVFSVWLSRNVTRRLFVEWAHRVATVVCACCAFSA